MIVFGYKNIIKQYEERIADLKKQIEDLRSISLPVAQSRTIPNTALEADAILSGRSEVFEPTQYSEKELELLRLEQSERDRILSGTYTNGLE